MGESESQIMNVSEHEREFVIVRDGVGVKAKGVKGIKCKS